MEQIPPLDNFEPSFHWRNFKEPWRFAKDEQETLDQIAELAAEEKVDFEKIAKERRVARASNHPESAGEANPIDEMIVWAYAKQIITAVEVRNLQKKLHGL